MDIREQLYLKADSKEYLVYLKTLKEVSRGDFMIRPVKTEYGFYRGFLLNGFQETTAWFICEYE